MPRRSGVPKEGRATRSAYGSKVVTKVINQVMLDGKKVLLRKSFTAL